MKIKISEADGWELDYAVAKAQDRKEIKIFRPSRKGDRGWVEVRFNPEPKAGTARFDPSINWEYGGPIIEREKIGVYSVPRGLWVAFKYQDAGRLAGIAGAVLPTFKQYAPTPLIAAMRCYCCVKLGDEIDIPEELQPCQQPNL